jgi:cyanate lyase
MRVNFELKFGADTYKAAQEEAYREVAKFLSLDEEAVKNSVDLELKVAIPDAEKDTQYNGHFLVTAYGHVKNSISKPF